MKKNMALQLRIQSTVVGLGLEEGHLYHLRLTLLFLPLERKIRTTCRFMGFLCSLRVQRIPRKNQVPVDPDPLLAEQSHPLLLLMFNPICELGRSNHSSRLPGNREGAGHQSCIGDLSVPCSNLEVHKVRQ